MKNGLRTLCSRLGVTGAMLLILSACGGGGGGGGGGGFLPANPNAGLTNYVLNLTLTDAAGNPVATVTPNSRAILRATVTEQNSVGAAVEGVIVSASVEFAALSPENGSAVTDAQGVAIFEITGAQILGADEAVVTVESPAGTVTASVAFQILDISLNFDVTLLDADGFETSFIAPDQPGELRVRVTQQNPDGSETVPDEPIVVTTQTGFATVSPSNGSALTNAQGIATFGLAPNDASGADTAIISATISSGDEFSTEFPFQIFTAEDEFSISLALIDGSGALTNQIDAASPATLRALLTRSNPISGVVGEPVDSQILFAASSDGIITPENGAALTDSSGAADFGVAAGSSLGAQTLTVSVNGPGGTTSAELPYQVVADVEGSGYVALFLELQLRNAVGQAISAFERGESGFLRVRVLGRREGSQLRELVPGIPVSIAATNGLISPASGNLLTNGSGEANFVIEAGGVSGTDVITASVLGPVGPVSESVSYDVTGVLLRFTTRLLDESGLQTSFIAPGQPGQLRVTVREQNANGSQSVPGGPVVVTATGAIAQIIPDNGSVVTDASGVAIFTLEAGAISGAEIITISAESDTGAVTTDEFPLQVFTGSDEFTISLVLLDSRGAVTTQIDPGSPGELVAILRRSNPLANIINAPVAGQILELSLTDGTVTPANGSRLTNADGEARFGVAAGDSIGAQVATVTVTAPSGVVSAELPYEVASQTVADGFSALSLSLSLVDSAGQSISDVLPGQSAFLEARVTGRTASSQVNVAAAGIPVTLVSQSSSITPPSGNVVTDSNGVARFRVVAGTGAGPDILTATVVGPLGPVVDALTYQVIDAELVLVPVLLNGDGEETSFISSSQPGTLRVSVLERNQAGVLAPPSAPVTVTAAVGFATLSPDNGASVTNVDGNAFFELTAGDTSGADLVNLAAQTAGGDSVSATLPFEIFTDNDQFTLTLTLLDSNGAVTNEIDAGAPGTLVALLTRNNNSQQVNGQPVPGQIVRASLSAGAITPANGAALTNGVGEARFGVIAGTTLGAETATVTVDGPDGLVSAELAYQVVDDVADSGFVNLFLNLRLLDSAGMEITQLSRGDDATLEVFVEGRRAGAQTRIPAAGVPVTAAVQNGALLPETGALLTDANGIALFSISAGTAATGTDIASATVISPAGPITESLAYDILGAGLVFDIVLLDDGGNATSFISPDSSGTLQVTVLEQSGSGAASIPAAGIVVRATTGFAQLSPGTGTALTDGNGVALFRLDAGTTSGADTVNVSATLPNGDSFDDSLSFAVFTAADEFELNLSLSRTSGAITTQVDAANPATLRAVLTRSNSVLGISNAPVGGQILTATLSDGVITPANGSVLTDASGAGAFSVAAGSALGAQTATVTVTTPVGPQTATLAYEVVDSIDGNGFANLSLTLALVDGNGSPVSAVTSGQPAFLEVTVNGQPVGGGAAQTVDGVQVSVSSLSAVIVPGSGNALTGADGVARFTVSAGAVAGTDVLTATVLGPAGPVSDTLSFDVDATTFNITLQLLPSNRLVLGVDSQLELQVTVTDSAGAPVADVIADASTALGLVQPDNTRALTNASGVARFFLTPVGQTGADEISISLSREGFNAVRSINYEVVRPQLVISGLQLLDTQGAPASIVAAGAPLTVEATVTDEDGQPVSGAVVDASTGVAQLDPANGRALTNAAGIARFTLSATAQAGSDTVQLSVTSEGVTSSRSIAYSVAASQAQIELQLLNGQGLPDSTVRSNQPLTLQAVVTSASGTPLGGVVLSAATGVASITPANGQAITNSSGIALFTLSAGGQLGADTVSVSGSVDGATLSDSIGYQVGEPELDVTLRSENSQGQASTTVSSTDPLTIVVTVADNGTPRSGLIVEGAAALASVSPANGRALTDSNGEARFVLTAGTSFGADSFTVTLEADGATIVRSAAYEVVDEAPLTLSLALVDAQGLPGSTVLPNQPLTLEATVTTAGGDPVAGQIVGASTALANLAPANGQAITDSNGVARFTLSSGANTGADSVTVTVDDGSVIATDSIAYQVGEPPVDVALELVNAQGAASTALSANAPLTLRVTVTDNGAAVSGQLVVASTTLASITPANGQALTNASGVAEFVLTAGATDGADNVSVSIDVDGFTVVRSTAYQVVDEAPPILSLALLNAGGLPDSTVLPNQPLTLEVTLTSAGGAPLAGQLVQASTAVADLTPGNGQAVTDATGVARFTLSAGTQTGADLVTVSYTDGDITATDSIAYQVGEPPVEAVLTLLDPQGAAATVATPDAPLTLRVSVTENGAPLQGQLVTAATTLATLSPASGSALTNAAGIAEFTLAAGSSDGADVATVTLDVDGFSIVRSVGYSVEGSAPSLQLELLDQGVASRQVLDGAPLTLEVLVLSRDGNPLSGQLVTASTTLATLLPGNGQAVTDANGIASFTLEAGSQTGADDVSVSVTVQGATVTESIAYQVGVSPLDVTLSLLNSGGQNSSLVRLNDPLTLEVLVELNGTAQEGQVVEATTDTAVLSPANGRTLTDGSGIARFTLAAGTGSGAGTVQVTIDGDPPVVRAINYEVLEQRFDLVLTVVDGMGAPTTLVTSAQPAILRVQAVSLNVPAEPVAGFIARATGNLVQISPEAGTALTDSNGIAEFTLNAGDIGGADLITVSLDTGTTVVTETVGVQVNTTGLNIGGFINGVFTDGQIGFTVTDLAYGGNTRINLAVVDDLGDLVITANQIRLTSDCSIRGESGFRNVGDAGPGASALVINTEQGLAAAEYNATSCEGTDTITATLIGENLEATGDVTIASLNAGYIGFFSADPAEGPETGDRTVIALEGTGGAPAGRPEIARITFEVLTSRPGDNDPRPGDPTYLDREDRVPVANAEVILELTNDLAGIELCDPSGGCTTTGTITLNTDQDGLIVVEVNSGAVPAQTFVIASYTDPNSGTTVTTSSSQIVVSTGLPDQNSLSISVSQGFYVANAANVDGVERTITARVADRFNNPVPDGTAVIFRTEYGAIDASCETGKANGSRLIEQDPTAVPARGTCSVLWTSQSPRLPSFLPSSGEELVTIFDAGYTCPSHAGTSGPCPDDLGPVRGLRSSILAYVLGEEDFTDLNGNGLFDAGEEFNNCEEAFIDFNEDATYSANFFEEFIDIDNDNAYGDGGSLNGGAVYNGTLCTQADEAAGICSRSLINVRDNGVGCESDFGTSPIVLTLSSSGGNQRAVLERTGDDSIVPSGSLLPTGVSHALHVADLYNNRPGNGTEVTFEIDDVAACTLLVAGNFLGFGSQDTVTVTINDAGDAPGATTLSPIIVIDDDPDPLNPTGGTILVAIDGFFLYSFSCD